MLSHEIVERLAPIFNGSDSEVIFAEEMQPALQLVAQLAVQCEHIYGKIDELSSSDVGKYQAISAEIQRLIVNVRSLLSQSRPRKFFESYEFMLKAFRGLSEIDTDGVFLEFLLSDLELFSDAYDDYLAQQIPPRAWLLLRRAHDLNAKIDISGRAYFSIYQQLGGRSHGDIDNLKGCDSLSLSLPESDDYSALVLRLIALGRLYSEICRLLGVSEEAAPLKVVKVESGSLWVKVFGESRVLGLVAKFVECGVGFIYRKYTLEGKVSMVPQNVDAVDKLIGLRKSLCDNGIDVGEMDQEIAAASIAIAKSLNQLLKEQSSIKINGKKFSVGDADAMRYRLESKASPMLEHHGPDLGVTADASE